MIKISICENDKTLCFSLIRENKFHSELIWINVNGNKQQFYYSAPLNGFINNYYYFEEL